MNAFGGEISRKQAYCQGKFNIFLEIYPKLYGRVRLNKPSNKQNGFICFCGVSALSWTDCTSWDDKHCWEACLLGSSEICQYLPGEISVVILTSLGLIISLIQSKADTKYFYNSPKRMAVWSMKKIFISSILNLFVSKTPFEGLLSR